jgi:hypothetical protein
VKLISKNSIISAGLALTLTGFGLGTASATPIELALVIDGSGSISASDWTKQLNGYKAAFTTGSFFTDYIAPSKYDSLVVSAFQFSTGVVQEIGWTIITSNAEATAFGNLFAFNQDGGWTNTEGAIKTAMNSILGNGIDGGKLVIDISTDGDPTICDGGTSGNAATGRACDSPSTTAPEAQAIDAADAARLNGITVNAIGVGAGVQAAFLNNLVAPSGFFMVANSFDDFAGTLERKLEKEIIGVPEPSVLFLFGTGLLCVVIGRRRKFTV